MAIIFVFIDGIGIGKENEFNPFYTNQLPAFEILSGGKLCESCKEILSAKHVFKHIDANLEMDGLPQSGTGQASLFCGKNMSQLIGKHFGPYAHSQTKPFLKDQSLFSDVLKLGKSPHFINAYPKPFFVNAEKRSRWSCTTWMTMGAGLTLNTEDLVVNGFAVTAEIKQDYWRKKLGIELPEISEAEAAQRILKKTNEHDVVLFEYFLTDKAGHEQNPENAFSSLDRIDKLLQELIKEIGNNTLIITSDHGNIENLSVKTHTRNAVPLFAYGEKAHVFEKIESIIDVKKAILKCFE
jgi:2,3-bisphosphoglycerate-independent phosphoglycerate mutase